VYPRPVDLRRVRVLVLPWLFRLPWFRRFDGYAGNPYEAQARAAVDATRHPESLGSPK